MSISHYDKLIVLNFRPGAGGKFLANCLGFSSQVVLQDRKLAHQQLNNTLSPKQKFELIIDRLDNAGDIWNDLNLNDFKYFEPNWVDYELIGIEDHSQLHPICKEVCDQNLFFIACFHNIPAVKSTLKKWPKAKVIRFINDQHFLTTYRKLYLDYQTSHWDCIKGSSWPVNPPYTTKELQDLPKTIQNELENLFENSIYNQLSLTSSDLPQIFGQDFSTMSWDCDWYCDIEATTNSVEKIYRTLGLTDFNADWIRIYWGKWMAKINLVHQTWIKDGSYDIDGKRLC